MKSILLHSSRVERLLARFGAAQLVKRLDGQVELRGGNREERQDAREWLSLFLHDAPFGDPSHG